MARDICEVAVPVPVHDTFTYRIPPNLTGQVAAGVRVAVPFGARKLVGVVTALRDKPRTHHALKSIAEVLDPEPVLPAKLLQLARWVGDYYAAPIGEVFRAMLPLHGEYALSEKAQLTEAGRARLAELEEKPDRGKREEAEHQWLAAFRRRRLRTVGGLIRSLDGGTQRLAHLRAKGWIEVVRAVRKRRTSESSPGAVLSLGLEPAGHASNVSNVSNDSLVLTSEQERALTSLEGAISSGKFSTLLLHGVTGSGKTEVYARAIECCLAADRGAILLVPEIALTPAVAGQFAARFGEQVAVLHSGLTARERSGEWWRLRRGAARVVIGTRSAVFAPVENPGLIIVDEEQDSSYKQGETPRYHGRDTSVVRAKLEGAVALLGSATPSLETAGHARSGRYQLLSMPSRVAGRALAEVSVVDMRAEFAETGKAGLLSRQLVEGMQSALAGGGQVLVLRNRRGYANIMLCRKCGEAARCINCSISLTYHRRRARLVCHYCGYTRPVPGKCEQCASDHIYFVGEGTEKVEEAVQEALPHARVGRLDRDTAAGRRQGEAILRRFFGGELDVLVGTQMIAKGHDFQGVSLVGVVSADAMLGLPDFRAGERTFQLLTQVAGRAGRGDLPGRVLVQSYYPEHYAVELAAAQDFDGFYEKEMHFRRVLHYPPFVALANVILRDKKVENAIRYSRVMQDFFDARKTASLRVLGPASAPIARLKKDYRFQFLLKSVSRSALQELLKEASAYAQKKKIPPAAWIADVDPLNLL